MTLPLSYSAWRGWHEERLLVPRSKRAMDVVLTCACLAVIWPLLAAIWLAVRLTSPGPAIFRQERLGLGGRPFTLYKFRTMATGAPDSLHRQYVTALLTQDQPSVTGATGLYKLDGDPRVTSVGRWLRRTSLDELPQLINVLRGEMSLVGPRPCLAWEAELYRERDRRRFDVLPGITGLWQVSGRSRLTMREALDLDVEYVRRRSLLLDVVILTRTVRCLLRVEAA
jgi:lipopolysaccharide/colanic/teichoic acid biosynthesis glycosyltransferase